MHNPMDIIDAAYKTVHEYPHGGSAALAARMGFKSVALLNNKVNKTATAHHLRLDEAVSIMELTGDHAIVHAIAYRLGGVYCEVNTVEPQKEDLIMTALSASASSGNVIQELHHALEDGQISCEQRNTLLAKIQDAQSVLQSLAQSVKDKHAIDNPHVVAYQQAHSNELG